MHKLAINNFLAETINFYLKNKQMTFFASQPSDADGIVFDTSKEYIMDIKLSRDTSTSVSSSADMSDGPLLSEFPAIYEALSSSYRKSIQMYEREASFGPPVSELIISGGGALASSAHKRYAFVSSAPYTPPYYDGFARVRYAFQPTSTTHTLEDIVRNSSKTYYRSGILSGTYPAAKWEQSGTYAFCAHAQLSWTRKGN